MATNPTIQFKRKITSGTPSTLSIGEPAVNTADNQLFIGVNSNAIKWVGAEIENSSTNGTTWSSDLKLPTKKAVGDYFAALSGATFTGPVSFGQSSTAAGEIRLLEDTDDGSNYSAFRGSARSANITYVMPTSDPTAGQVLSAGAPSSNVSTLSWIDSGSASTIAVTDDDATTTLYPMFSTVTSGSTTTKIDSDGMTYNASTDSLTIPGDLAVNGADITTTSTGTATVFNTNATTLNVGGAATTMTLGYNSTAASTTNISTGAVGATNTKTINVGTGGASGSETTVNIGSASSSNAIYVGSGGPSIVYDSSSFISSINNVNALSSFARSTSYPYLRIANPPHSSSVSGDNAAIDLYGSDNGTSQPKTCNILPQVNNSVTSTVNIGGAISGNTLKINGTAGGTTTLSSDVTTGTVNLFSGVTTGTVNLANGGASIVEVGSTIRSSQTTANVFNTTATTVNMAGAGTTVSIGAATGTSTINNANTVVTGDLAVNGADITTTATGTATVFNTNATTLNIGGAATTMTVGSSTATINLGGGTTGATINIKGNLVVEGTTTTVNSTTVTIDDLNIVLADGVSAAASADGGGITLGTTGITWNYLHSATSWSSSQNINVATGKTYKINSVDVLTATSLGSTVTSSSLTAVGTIATGVWNGTAIGVAYGGTGLTTYTTGQIVYASGSTTLAGLSASATAGAVVASTGSSSAPEYKTISVTNGSVTSGSGTLTLAIQDAAANGSTKGLAAFNSTQFDDASGVITLDTIDGGTYA